MFYHPIGLFVKRWTEDEYTDGKKKEDTNGRTKVGKRLKAVGGDDECRFIDTCFSVLVILL